MGRPRTKSVSALLQELHISCEQQERELVSLRLIVDRLRTERDELSAQLRFATEHANRETRAAGGLRAELLARNGALRPTSRPPSPLRLTERLDFCCADEGGETT